MTIPFSPFFERVRSASDVASQMDLAAALGVNRSAITQAKLRDAVPPKWILALSRKYGLSPDWLEYGSGAVHGGEDRSGAVHGGAPGGGEPSALRRVGRAVPVEGEDMVEVPKAAALLCAGGGSFEVDATPVAAFPFPRWWLARMGSPADMVFMDVVGDSMEPTVYDGDTVLVDQGNTRLDAKSIFAVGVDEAIYLKRVETAPNSIVLHSDNPRYSALELFGDELAGFRVIGKMVWLCRDCR